MLRCMSSWVGAVGSTLWLAGCASVVPSFDVPRDPATNSPTVASIVDRLTCELANLVAPGSPNAPELLTGQYEVAVQLDLTVNDAGSLAPSFTYINGPFVFGAGAKLEQSREQVFSEKLYYSLIDLRYELDESEAAFRAGRTTRRLGDCATYFDTNLAGDLGIRQAVDLAFSSNYLRTSAKASEKGAFGGSINFTVTKNLNGVGPTWTLTHFKGPGGLGALSEVNTDRLTFAFAVSEHPLSEKQLAQRGLGKAPSTRTTPLIATTVRINTRAEDLLRQLQINQISNQLSTIRALQ